MSRIANNPITIPSGVEVNISGDIVTIKGSKGELTHNIHPLIKLEQSDDVIKTLVKNNSKFAKALSGTTRALIQNIITGVSEGFERKLEITGVGYRAAVSGKALNLTLGFSHPVKYQLPEEVQVETPSQTEVVLKSHNKQILGQAAAEIRAFRPPEPYKGKGVRYSDENVRRKEAKKAAGA